MDILPEPWQLGALKLGTCGFFSRVRNTKQLRNQYVAEVSLGYPMCLTACPKKDLTHKPVSIFT